MIVSAMMSSKRKEKNLKQFNLGECIQHMKPDPFDVAPTIFLITMAFKSAVLRAQVAKHVELLILNAFSYRSLQTREQGMDHPVARLIPNTPRMNIMMMHLEFRPETGMTPV